MILPPVLPFKQFQTIPYISRMTLREQIAQYDLYFCETMMRYEMECAPRGASSTKTKQIVSEGFLQQEDLSYILQEDGSKIYVTLEKEV